ncbi:MAG: efflux RND transporter permease subunit, partial [Anaerolineales bacterium]
RVIKNILSGIEGATGVVVSREPGSEEIRVILDRDRMRGMGLAPAMVASYIRYALYGVTATTIRREGTDIDIFLRLDPLSRKNIATLENLQIPTPLGKFVPLANIAQIQIARSPLTIERKNKMRYVRVECDVVGKSIGEFTREMKNKLAGLTLPHGVTIKVAGQAKEQAESFNTLFIAFIVGIIFVYLIMAAQFESFLDPFIIIFSVPFVVVGIVLLYLLTGKIFSLMSYVGMVMLVGIVVNNAIVLVDYMNILRWRGYPLDDVLLIGCSRRLRPILMTTLTTIFGLVPLVISRKTGSEMWQPLGLSVIGGLLVSTFASLIIVPIIYSIFERYLKRIAL